MIILFIVITIISSVFATDEVSVYPQRIIRNKNPYLAGALYNPMWATSGSNKNSVYRIGGGAWHIPDSLNFAWQDEGSYDFGHIDSSYYRMLKDAGISVLMSNAFDWKVMVGPWRDSCQFVYIAHICHSRKFSRSRSICGADFIKISPARCQAAYFAW